MTTEGESVERPTLTTSWREAVAEGRPLYADDGLLTDRSAAVAPAAEPAADGWTRRAEAAALLSRGRAEEALSLLRDGAALSTAEAHLRIAALRAAGEAERAREALVTATHREPTNPALWWERGDLLEESGDERGAAQARKIAASLDRRAAHAGIY